MAIKRILKINSGHDLFIFKTLLIAIDWSFKNCTITYT